MHFDIDAGRFAPENRQTNPGSQYHYQDKKYGGPTCKPCNKYNPERPLDSCKHGDKCDFCHEPHERPKHRGQRGRHALQRRQYLEGWHEHPPLFRKLVDQIYEVPHRALDEVKNRLHQMTHWEREEKAFLVLERIRELGEWAQNARSDSNRLRGARISPQQGSCFNELDGRTKWLVGTLHLMVRKMFEAKEGEQSEIESIVQGVLNACKTLPLALDGFCPPVVTVPRQTSASAAASSSQQAKDDLKEWIKTTKLPSEFEWLDPKLHRVMTRELQTGTQKVKMEKMFDEICKQCDETLVKAAERKDKDSFLGEPLTLQEMSDNIDSVIDAYKERLFGAQSLEDFEDENKPSTSSDLFRGDFQ